MIYDENRKMDALSKRSDSERQSLNDIERRAQLRRFVLFVKEITLTSTMWG